MNNIRRGEIKEGRHYLGSLSSPALAKVRISQRGICLFLALVMLLSPEGLVQLAQADVQYSQLGTNSWGKGGQTITYTSMIRFGGPGQRFIPIMVTDRWTAGHGRRQKK